VVDSLRMWGTPKRWRRRASMGVIILILAMTATAIIISTLSLTSNAAAVQRSARAREQAVFLADAGLEHAMIMLKNNPLWRTGHTNVTLGGGTYTTTLIDDIGDVLVTSTGTVNSFSVQFNVRVGWL